MHHADFEQFFRLKRRQHTAKPLGQHGFARTGRAYEQNIVCPRRRDFERA
jgi:hypothetical protein